MLEINLANMGILNTSNFKYISNWKKKKNIGNKNDHFISMWLR